MCNKKTLRSDIRKCKAICKALKFHRYADAFSSAKLKSDIWVWSTEEVNKALHTNIKYDAENGSNYGCKLAKSLCKQLKDKLEEMGE